MKKLTLILAASLILLLLAGFGYYRHLTSKDFRLVVMNESPELVALRIMLGADVNQPDARGYPPLCYALNGREKRLVFQLKDTEHGVPVIRKRASDADVVRLLLDAGADISMKSARKENPLLIAIFNRDVDTVKLLLDRGVNPNAMDRDQSSAVTCAVQAFAPDLVEMLIAAGADVNTTNEDGETALLIACKTDQIQLIEILLKAGARTDTITSDGLTLIDVAMEANDEVSMLNTLITYAKTALPKPNDRYLYNAVCDKNAMLVRLLLKCGANVNAHDEDFYPLISLMMGASTNLGIVASLIEAGVDVNVREKNGRTPLTVSISNKKELCTQLLIAAGADLNLDGKSTGPFPLHDAAEVGNLELVRRLLAKGANPNVYDESGYTALHTALVGSPDAEMIKLLLDHGANPDIQPKSGDLFFDESNEEIMRLLKSHSKASPAP